MKKKRERGHIVITTDSHFPWRVAACTTLVVYWNSMHCLHSAQVGKHCPYMGTVTLHWVCVCAVPLPENVRHTHTHLLTVCLPLLSFLATFITSGVGRHRHRAGNKRKSLTGTLPYEDQILSLRENCAVVKIDKRKRWKVRTLTQPDKTDPVAHLRHAGMSRLCCAQWH